MVKLCQPTEAECHYPMIEEVKIVTNQVRRQRGVYKADWGGGQPARERESVTEALSTRHFLRKKYVEYDQSC